MAANAISLIPSIFRHDQSVVTLSSPSMLMRRFNNLPPPRLARNVTTLVAMSSTRHKCNAAVSDNNNTNQTQDEEKKGASLEASLNKLCEQARELLIVDDQDECRGPPRWFSPVDCGNPTKPHSPLLLFLPGIDGSGVGLVRHHNTIGKHFHLSCLHIPPDDRTPFQELVKLVATRVRAEHEASPGRPIYVVGESLGACLALSVAALNPDVDLLLILANPATSFSWSPLQAVLSLLQLMPDTPLLPHLLSSISGAMMARLEKGVIGLLLPQSLEKISRQTVAPAISNLYVLAELLPRETLIWKLQLMSTASAYVNPRLYAVKATTVILSSGRDTLLPSQTEGQRLKGLLETCHHRTFKDAGHFLLLDDSFDLLTAIKNVGVYRCSKERDYVTDYIPPSTSEFMDFMDRNRWINMLMNPVILSTLADGKIVRGFAGIPTEGPVLYVGNHMLLGIELWPMIIQMFKQVNVHLRGLAHPAMFLKMKDGTLADFTPYDDYRLIGCVPVSGKNFYKLLSKKSHVLLYPGGLREAFHRKGEAYKLFWPQRSEFVRMAARFGAKIVPFSIVGEDDLGEIFFDYEDQMKIPSLRKYIEDLTAKSAGVRSTDDEEIGNQALHLPAIAPKFPGRFYYKFGKPIETAGRKQELQDKERAHELYLEVKSEVEESLAYLLKKRESDPYRNVVTRLQYQVFHGFSSEVPSFDLD